jgi:hypothetical protein
MEQMCRHSVWTSWTPKGYSRTGLSSPLDLTVANSAHGHYSRYWVYSPCADHHNLLLVKSWWFFLQWIRYLENSSIKSFCQADYRLLWPLKLNHYLRQWSVFIWRNSQSVHSTFHTNLNNCTVRSPNKLFSNSIWQESKS